MKIKKTKRKGFEEIEVCLFDEDDKKTIKVENKLIRKKKNDKS